MKTIKVAYIADGDARSVKTWSGTTFYIAKSLENQGFKIHYIDNLNKIGPIEKIYAKLMLFLGIRYHPGRTLSKSRKMAREIEKKLPGDTDVVFAPSGTIPMAFLRTSKKKIIYNDATFACMTNYYPEFKNLCIKTLREGNIIDKEAFENCDLLLFSSKWAAESAIADYKIDPKKVKVVPFGANLDIERSEHDIRRIVSNRLAATNRCNLLFIGVDWGRKGGDIALSITESLRNKRSVNAHLNIVGIKRNLGMLPDYVINNGFVSKSDESGNKILDDLFKNAHFFVLPTRHECTAIVYSEAASYGLPIITTRTGGVPTIVIDNLNGLTFDFEASPDLYAEHIAKVFCNPERYEELCLSTFADYEKRLNWRVIGEQIKNYVAEIVDSR